jgi:tRNA dimethylallyltransferase
MNSKNSSAEYSNQVKEMNKPLVVVVVGPTASGKTSLGIEIAERLGGEIVSADSMQIYENMDIATAKPTPQEQARVKHHLVGFVPMGEKFSVAKYKEKATQAIDDILSREKLPVVVGGTGLYIDTLINNTEFLDYEESDIRTKLEERCRNEGIEALLEELGKIDPDTAGRLHINDTKRIIRALEVYYSTGKTISQQDELSHKNESKYRFCIIGLNAKDRQYLYDRINLRVDLMLEAGLLEETRAFFASEVSATAAQAIGYKELKPYINSLVSLEEATDKLKMESRRYAKRQLTWFRRNSSINWLYIDDMSSQELIDKACRIIENER